jgi:hypothetical protein
MNTSDVLKLGRRHLRSLVQHRFGVLDVAKPASAAAAINLTKIVSKLSPMVGNLIEFNVCEFLNEKEEFAGHGRWERQDPGFPDTVFSGGVTPTPGFEIKAWMPLSTEITARFKDSQNHFLEEQTDVAMLAWLPEFLIYGKPLVVDIVVVSAGSVAEARDVHYHDPPDYLVLEPQDTTERTSNLQQTNTNGYKFQGNAREFEVAKASVDKWGPSGPRYSTAAEYQARIRDLMGQYPYRLDTNFAKMDRIAHSGIEDFKERVLRRTFHGQSVRQWNKLLSRGTDAEVREALVSYLPVVDSDMRVAE